MKILTAICFLSLIGCTKTPEPNDCPPNARTSPYTIEGTFKGDNTSVRFTYGIVSQKNDSTYGVHLHLDTCDAGAFGFSLIHLILNDSIMMNDSNQPLVRMFMHNGDAYLPAFINTQRSVDYVLLTSLEENKYQLEIATYMLPIDSPEQGFFFGEVYDSVFISANLILQKK